MHQKFAKDLEKIGKIPIIGTLLDVVCQTTGMGFAAVARVTEDTWMTCAVRDDIGFGLKPGDELQLKTTICNEIRQTHQAVIIDHVAEDEGFRDHHTPAMYGFQSYISIPIMQKDGSFFGTLCAIDPRPNSLNNPTVIGMFSLFADLISFHIVTVEEMELSESKYQQERVFNHLLETKIQERTRELEENNAALLKVNKELESFAYISNHDLQEPLRKIQTFASRIAEKEYDNLSEYGKNMFRRMQASAERMQTLIDDLLAYSRTHTVVQKFERLNLRPIIEEVMLDLQDEIQQKRAIIHLPEISELRIIPVQFRLVIYNLISNALKFSSKERPLEITIESEQVTGEKLGLEYLKADVSYTHIRISDTGIGFNNQYNEKIFGLFQRLHGRDEYPGTGMGLAIAKKIMENHKGGIAATGTVDQGAIFDLYLPVGGVE